MKKTKEYKNLKWLTLQMVQDAFDNRYERTLVYFLLIKQLHVKPIIYNYSLRSLSRELKCSASTLSRHLDIMAHRGLIRIENGHLKLLSTRNMKKQKHAILVPVQTSKNKHKQLTFLRFVPIKYNLSKQEEISTIKNNVIDLYKNPLRKFTVKEIKKIKKQHQAVLKGAPVESLISEEISLSNVKFGLLCNRKQTTGAKIQKELNKYRLIKSTRQSIRVSEKRYNRRAFFELNLPSQYTLSKFGYIYLSKPNKVADLIKKK